jgi:hypothetical protein
MSRDRRLFIRYFNATFLWVCPSTLIFWSSVSIVNSRLANLVRLSQNHLMFTSVNIAGRLSQLIVHDCNFCRRLSLRPTSQVSSDRRCIRSTLQSATGF